MLETQMSIPATIDGVKVNSAVGFAYSATSREDAENDAILEVFEKGYTYRDKVIRHAKVIVNKK